MPTLFLCESNAGPSQLAEALARAHVPGADVWSAGVEPSHVRPEVRRILGERGIPPTGLRAKGLWSVPIEEITLVVRIGRNVDGARLPAGLRVIDWQLPDPDSYPDEEKMEAYRASAEEIERRLRQLPVADLR